MSGAPDREPAGRPAVVVFDYGFGNVRSAVRALQAAGAQVQLTDDTAAARAADGCVVPGVGAFAACMAGLVAAGGDAVVRDRLAAGAPVLGICVGMQVLFESGAEHGHDAAGLGVLPGRVERLHAQRLPHMGWNTVEPGADTADTADTVDTADTADTATEDRNTVEPAGGGLVDPNERYYFVHSYGVRTDPGPETRTTWAEHGGDRFVAAVEAGPLAATQFHPEKSGEAGAALLRHWVARLR